MTTDERQTLTQAARNIEARQAIGINKQQATRRSAVAAVLHTKKTVSFAIFLSFFQH